MIASRPEVPAPFANTIITIANQSFVAGMNNAMLVGALVMLVNALLVLMILLSRIRSPRPEPKSVEAPDG
jgi:hypothetical protein